MRLAIAGHKLDCFAQGRFGLRRSALLQQDFAEQILRARFIRQQLCREAQGLKRLVVLVLLHAEVAFEIEAQWLFRINAQGFVDVFLRILHVVLFNLNRGNPHQRVGILFVLPQHLLIFLFRLIKTSGIQRPLRIKHQRSRPRWELRRFLRRFDRSNFDLLIRLLEQCLLFRRVRDRFRFECFQARARDFQLPLQFIRAHPSGREPAIFLGQCKLLAQILPFQLQFFHRRLWNETFR